ncbi:T9SS type A sorting domain-containing protein [Candidatus Poribacteria bacterium]|nr:T9SS type A sorting domain-containing protein [Candidatus Poribacteria bacterium]
MSRRQALLLSIACWCSVAGVVFAAQSVDEQTVSLVQKTPTQEAGPFFLFGKPFPLQKGFSVRLTMDVTHQVRVDVGDRSLSFQGVGGDVAGSGLVALQGGEIYQVVETYTFRATVDSIFIRGEFPVEVQAKWNLLALDTGVYAFAISGHARDLTVNVTGDIAGGTELKALGSTVDVEVETIRDIPGGEKLVYGGSFTGFLDRTSTLTYTGKVVPDWDVNSDGSVNIVDLVLVARKFGEVGVKTREDVNGDTVVNIIDLVLVARHFGESLILPAAAPALAADAEASVGLGYRRLGDGSMQVDVQANSLTRLAGADVTLAFDPSAWSLADARAGAAFSTPFSWRLPASDGMARLLTVALPVDGDTTHSGEVARFTFRPLTPNAAVKGFSLRQVALSDARGRIVLTRMEPPARFALPTGAQRLAVGQNYPNPFNPETWIPFSISEPTSVRIDIFSEAGDLVRTLDLGTLPAGAYASPDRAVRWDGENDSGEPVASGVYVYRLTTGSNSQTRRMVVVK